MTPVKIKHRHRQFCRALLEESIGRPIPCWVSIDKLADLLRVSYEAAFVLAYDCEKAGLVRFYQPEAMKGVHVPQSACLTDEGWRRMRKSQRRIDEQSPAGRLAHKPETA